MTKQEAIKKAYGIFYEKVSPSNDGWVSYDNWFKYIGHEIEYEYQDAVILNVRPISLKGIEYNNGWISLKSEDDLPKTEIYCWVIDKEFGTSIGYFDKVKNKFFCSKHIEQYATHYQPIVKPEPPIF